MKEDVGHGKPYAPPEGEKPKTTEDERARARERRADGSDHSAGEEGLSG